MCPSLQPTLLRCPLLRTVKALCPRSITTCRIEGGLLRKRAQDAVLCLVPGVQEADRDRLGDGTVLDPGAHLIEDGGWLSACTAGAVLQPGDLEDAEEIVDVGEHLGDGLVVVSCALGWDVLVCLGLTSR